MNQTDSKKTRLLIVEDDRFIIRVLSDKFSRRGYDVVIASNGKEALNKVKSHKPDLMVMDLIMPGMDGFEVLEKIKQTADYKDIPVVILSNLGQESDIAKCKKLGAVEYLTKSDMPISAIVERIEEIIVRATGK